MVLRTKQLCPKNNQGKKGRPRAEIAPEIVLNAFKRYDNSIRGTARALGISSGLCYHRLKESGVVPLGTGKGGKRKNDL
jgi:hypothetical protein